MRPIDADALREKWLCLQGHDFSPSSFVYSIDNATTIDAVPVVRCEKCAYHSEIFLKGMEDFVWCDFFKVYRCKDSFCSCGRVE